MIKAAKVVAFIALARLVALGAFSLIDEEFEHSEWVSRLYLPAGVNVLLTLAFGPLAAFGVALGSLAWNLAFENVSVPGALALAVASGLSCALALLLFSRMFPHWSMPLSLWRIGAFILAYAFFNAVVHTVAFQLLPLPTNVGLVGVGWMFVGDLLGAFVLFLVANAITSAWIRVRSRAPHG